MADLGRALINAAKGGQLEAVRTLLGQQGADVDSRDVHQYTPLHWAASNGHVEVAELLLDSGASVDALALANSTPLTSASRSGHLAVAKLLVARGANVNHKCEGSLTPLFFAAWNDHLDVCLFLLSKGADLMVKYEVDHENALMQFGRFANPPLSPETLAERRTALEEAWHAGPHPSQVQRRRDEAWDRRKSLMQVTAENRFRPLSHVIAAMPPVDPSAAIPAIPLDNAEQLHAHLLGQVLSNEGIHRLIVSFL